MLENKLTVEGLNRVKERLAAELKLPPALLQFVSGVDEAALKKSIETLVAGIGPGPNVGGTTNPPAGNSTPKSYTRAEIDNMKPEDINKDWDNIQNQLKAGTIK